MACQKLKCSTSKTNENKESQLVTHFNGFLFRFIEVLQLFIKYIYIVALHYINENNLGEKCLGLRSTLQYHVT